MKFRNMIIKTLDELAFIAIVLVTIVCFIAGLASSTPFFAILYGIAGFVGSCFTFGFWLCISGIYANVKDINETLKANCKRGE